MNDLVSIIIPVYNHEKYLESCILSIIAQSYNRIEVIICDDCSSDKSFDLVCRYKEQLEKRFERVKIYRHNTNQGVCKTLNEMLKMSKGDYIKPIASDDMLVSDAIEKLLNFYKKNNCDIVFSNVFCVDEKFQYQTANNCNKKWFEDTSKSVDFDMGRLCSGNYICGASLFVRKETYEEFGAYDETYIYEDWEFCLRVGKCGKVLYFDMPTVYYRRTEGSLSHPRIDNEGREKNRMFYKNKKSIFDSYKIYCTKLQINKFYSQNLRVAILLEDEKLIKKIKEDAKEDRSRFDLPTMIRLAIYKLGIYSKIRKIKLMIKRKSDRRN